jgi:3-isopropylmalate/(R)-2-methylmalate dehydratase small subunit
MAREFRVERGRCCLLRRENIDTDIIIPQTELVTVSRSGLGEGLFARWRYTTGRTPNPDFVLNKPDNRGCRFLLAGTNFGCGSSREHAVWALGEFGIRAVIAPSFGEIFQRNGILNGVLPARVTPEAHRRLEALANAEDGIDDLVVDLVERRIEAGDFSVPFALDDDDRLRLLTGIDEIAETFTQRAAIDSFVAGDRLRRPWVYDRHWSR